MSILNNPSRWDGTDNLYKEDREEEASLILVLQECAEYVNNTDITKLTVQPIHGCSHLGVKGGRVGSSPPEVITGPSKPLGRSKSRILGCPENPRGESQIPKTIGFSGQMQLNPLTAPVCLQMKN